MSSSASSFKLSNGSPKTVIVTGSAGGIGAETIRLFNAAGCNVVIADLVSTEKAANELISTLSEPNRAIFHPANVVNWDEMRALFRATTTRFGQIDLVVANAGIMESRGFFEFEVDGQGELGEPTEAYEVLDVNVKGTMNSQLFGNYTVWQGSSNSISPATSYACYAG